MKYRRMLAILVATSTALRLMFAASIGPGNDEAYHALFALHLDWSYFDHPPLMALIARLGLLLSGGRLSAPAMRLGFILLGAGSTWLMACLTSRFYGERAGLIAAILLNATAYYSVAAATFILPDGPLLFFWLLTVDRLAAAMDDPRRLGPWIGAGLAWGGGMLSKYHAVFLPVGFALYLAIEPKARRVLRSPGPYLGCWIGMAIFSPVIVWNARHGWASFTFQAGRASGGTRFNPLALFGAIGGQAMYLMPWIWVFLWAATFRSVKRVRSGEDETRSGVSTDRFLLSQAIAPLTLFLVVACRQSVYPHWSLIGMLPSFPLLARDWSRAWPAGSPRLARRLVVILAVPVIGAALFVLQARTGFLQRGLPGRLGLLPVGADPTADMAGWDTVAGELRRRGWFDRPGMFVFTSKWYHSGHLAFATDNLVPVFCYNPGGGHGFDEWMDPGVWVGHDGLLVVINASSTEPGVYERLFQRIEPAGEFEVLRQGIPIRQVRLYHCVNQLRPYPGDSPMR